MPSRKLEDLHPKVEQLARIFLADCAKASGVQLPISEVFPTSTRRFFDEQAALYAIGRTVNLGHKRVTNSKPGYSWHEYGLALDVAILIQGKPVWDIGNFQAMGAIGQSVGLRWGGDAGFIAAGIVDSDHFEYTAGLNIRTALALFQQGGITAVWNEFDRLDTKAPPVKT